LAPVTEPSPRSNLGRSKKKGTNEEQVASGSRSGKANDCEVERRRERGQR